MNPICDWCEADHPTVPAVLGNLYTMAIQDVRLCEKAISIILRDMDSAHEHVMYLYGHGRFDGKPSSFRYHMMEYQENAL